MLQINTVHVLTTSQNVTKGADQANNHCANFSAPNKPSNSSKPTDLLNGGHREAIFEAACRGCLRLMSFPASTVSD